MGFLKKIKAKLEDYLLFEEKKESMFLFRVPRIPGGGVYSTRIRLQGGRKKTLMIKGRKKRLTSHFLI